MNSQLRTNAAPKKNLVLYFQVHQPKRLSTLRFFDIGAGGTCFDEALDKDIIQRVARECYLPANDMLLRLIRKHPGIRVSFSLSGVILDQLETYAPEALESFKALAETGSVEFLSETCHHSLACMMPGKEFEEQILKHAEKIYEHLGVRPTVFRNTELIYNDEIGRRISKMGYAGIIADGVERILEGRSPNHVFHHPDPEHNHFKVLLRNYRLSDDIAFRFSEGGKILTVDQYMSWLNALPQGEEVVTLGMDYETFGEHQKKQTGIFAFMEGLLAQLAASKSFRLITPAQAMTGIVPHSAVTVNRFISWADQERDLSTWLGNAMQRDAFDSLINLEFDVKNLDDAGLLEQWRNLLTSDHFYYMCTKKGSDGAVHAYFSHYPSPYEAFINYMNVLTDLSMRMQILKAGKSNAVRTAMAPDQWSQSMGSRMTMQSNH
jgi:alpha-amylase